MGKIFEIPFSKNIIKYTINMFFEENKKDYSKIIVVFPGKRPSLYLKKYLQKKINSDFIPPEIYSMDDFVKKSVNIDKKAVDVDINLVWLLYESIKDNLNRYKFGEEFEKFIPWGYKLLSVINEIDIEMISVKNRYFYLDSVPDKIKFIFENLNDIIEKFHKYLSDFGYTTRSIQYNTLANNTDISFLRDKILIFSGFFALTESEKRIIHNLLLKGDTTLIVQREGGEWKHFTDTIDKWIKDKDIQYENNNGFSPIADIKLVNAFDSHSEVIGVNNIITDIKDKENIGLILPDPEQLFPILNWVMDGIDVPYNVTMGYQLKRTLFFSLINIIFTLQENKNENYYFTKDFLKLLSHPYIKNLKYKDNFSFIRIVCEVVRKKLTDNKIYFVNYDQIRKTIKEDAINNILMMEQYSSFGICDIENIFVSIFDIFIKPFNNIKTLKNLSLIIESMLKSIYEKTHIMDYPLSKKFINAFLSVLDNLIDSDVSKIEMNDSKLFSIFRQVCEYKKVPFEGSPLKPLQIMGLLETRNISQDKVIIIDANEGVIPSEDTNDPLLPYGLRKLLKLPTYEDRNEIFKYYFERILRSSKEVYIVYIKSKDKERSRFVEKILWEGEKQNIKYENRKIKFNIDIKRKEESKGIKDNDVLNKLCSFEYSPSKIDTYMKCPFHFYMKYILKLEEEINVDDEYDRRDIGLFIHKGLEYLFNDKDFITILKSGQYKDSIVRMIEEKLKISFKEEIGEELGEKRLLLEVAKSAVRSYILDFGKEIEDDYKLISTEVKLKGGIMIENRSVKLGGFADRIDKVGNRFMIIDYKTGSSVKSPNLKKVQYLDMDNLNRSDIKDIAKSMQLPMYILMFKQMNPEIEYENIDSKLIYLREKNKNDRESILYNRKFDKTDIMENRFIPILKYLLGEILDKSIDFTSDNSDERYCSYCPYRNMC